MAPFAPVSSITGALTSSVTACTPRNACTLISTGDHTVVSGAAGASSSMICNLSTVTSLASRYYCLAHRILFEVRLRRGRHVIRELLRELLHDALDARLQITSRL